VVEQQNFRHPVVIVEDDDGMRQAVERLLGAAGYTTAAFRSAEALLETNTATTAACLVLDVRLPGMSGTTLRRRLADAGMHVPVIFMTAHDEPSSREIAAQYGALAYLSKPFARRDLLDAVARAVPSASKDRTY
jgi:FixJ family two-component response regulator